MLSKKNRLHRGGSTTFKPLFKPRRVFAIVLNVRSSRSSTNTHRYVKIKCGLIAKMSSKQTPKGRSLGGVVIFITMVVTCICLAITAMYHSVGMTLALATNLDNSYIFDIILLQCLLL